MYCLFIISFTSPSTPSPSQAGEPLMKRRRISRSSSQDAQDTNIANNNPPNNNNNNNNHNNNHNNNNNNNNNSTVTQNGDTSNGGMGSTYCGELVMFDRHGRSLLTPGHYELVLELQAGGGEDDSLPLCRSSPKKAAGWETISTLKLDGIFNHIPVLKFTLNWTNETSNPTPERPRLQPLKPLDVVLANSTSTKPRPQGKCVWGEGALI